MKTKQKEVTMWAIWSPHSKKINFNTLSKTRKEAWDNYSWREDGWGEDCSDEYARFLKKEGYRAVKGKFVWEEK